MEFDEMKKIWDEQNNETLFVINENAMHKSISAKNKKVNMTANINEIGLCLIVVITGLYLLWDAIVDKEGVYSYLAILIWVLIGVYVLIQRVLRKKSNIRFDRSMLGELDHAIENAKYIIHQNRTFVWWFMVPSAISIAVNMSQYAVPLWKWVVIPSSFILAYFVVWIGLKYQDIPRRKRLEGLRKKLTEDINTDE